MSRLVLGRAQTVQLIREYGSQRLLWDAADPRHRLRPHRARAWRAVAARLRAPVPDLKRKLVSLMGSYRREKSREKRSMAKGLGPDKTYKSKWFGYEHFHFMSEKTAATGGAWYSSARITHDDPPDGMKIEQAEYNEGDTDEVELEAEYKEEAAASPCGRAHRRRRSDSEYLLADAEPPTKLPHLDPSRDAYSTFGQYVASELRKYDDVTLSHVKHTICNVIFEADMGRILELRPRSASVAVASPECSNDVFINQ